jgi:predicted dithiol-disulfide oxidoreductase (DUF899 family)
MTAMQHLAPAAELAAKSETRFPRESDEYRKARTALLAEEIELRRHIQRVAEQRRALPPGPEAKDYRFLDKDGNELGLADLFGPHDTLFAYFWMYGSERERACPMCTSFVGSLDIPVPDIEQRVALAIIGRSPVERQLAFARDYRAFVDGDEGAAVLVFKREDSKVRLFWAAEGGSETADPGFDPHLAPKPTPLWNILDMTPGGRGADWYPKLEYSVTETKNVR